MRAALYSDGGARGNPGPAGIGFVLEIGGEEPIRQAQYIGEATNNQAEYVALKRGMERALREGVTALDCFLDSELVVRQLNGEYRIKNEGLRPLFVDIQTLRGKFERVAFAHVPRGKNKEADKLVNQAIDEKV